MTCGLDAVNAMLQGPVFNFNSMSALAKAIDNEEKELGISGASAFYES